VNGELKVSLEVIDLRLGFHFLQVLLIPFFDSDRSWSNPNPFLLFMR
jgi:hypothetical protein